MGISRSWACRLQCELISRAREIMRERFKVDDDLFFEAPMCERTTSGGDSTSPHVRRLHGHARSLWLRRGAAPTTPA